MQKLKIKHLRLELENGAVIEHDSGTFSASPNARKLGGYKNAQEWIEYHITWVVYKEDAPTPEPVEIVIPQGVHAEDYLSDPNFCGIEYGQPRFKKQQTQYDFDDFGFGEFLSNNNGAS